MQKLANREAQIMRIIWALRRAFINEIVDAIPDEPKPHYNTVSTMVKILEKKGFVAHEKLGNAHRYYPIVAEEDYQQAAVTDLLDDFFENSPMKLVNFFAKKQKIDADELAELIQRIKSQDP